MITASVIVNDLKKDLEAAWEIINRDFSDRYATRDRSRQTRPPAPQSGALARLGHPASHLQSRLHRRIQRVDRRHRHFVRDLVFIIKRFYKPSWEKDDWRKRFSVDLINGQPGRELIYRRDRLVTQYLRVGFSEDGTWRTFSLRKDFAPAKKIQTEDDIIASMVVPA